MGKRGSFKGIGERSLFAWGSNFFFKSSPYNPLGVLLAEDFVMAQPSFRPECDCGPAKHPLLPCPLHGTLPVAVSQALPLPVLLARQDSLSLGEKCRWERPPALAPVGDGGPGSLATLSAGLRVACWGCNWVGPWAFPPTKYSLLPCLGIIRGKGTRGVERLAGCRFLVIDAHFTSCTRPL